MSSVSSGSGGGGPGGPPLIFSARPVQRAGETKSELKARDEYWQLHEKQGYLAQEAKTAYAKSQQLIATLQTQLNNARAACDSLSNALARATLVVDNTTIALAQAQASQTAVQHFHQVIAPPVEPLD